MKKRIFLGTSEIAGMMTLMSESLKEQNYTVTTCCDNSNYTFYKNKYDIEIRSIFFPNYFKKIIGYRVFHFINDFLYSINRYIVFLKNRNKHDIYIFMWDGFFRNSLKDYKYLKKKGKIIITLCLGSDVRYIDSFRQEYKIDVSEWEEWFKKRSINQPLFRLRKAELYSDKIFSLPDQMGLALRPYCKLEIPFNTKNFSPIYHDRIIPKVVHIPSRIGIKGTKYILEAIQTLKNEGLEFEFEFVSGIENNEVISKLLDADILIDEAFLYGPGTLSLEAISCGCSVATKYEQNGRFDNAICYIDINNLYEPIKKLIIDFDYRKDLSRKALYLIKKINDPKIVSNNIIMNTLENFTKTDYIPDFYISKFKLEKDNINPINKALTLRVLKIFRYEYLSKIPILKKEGKL